MARQTAIHKATCAIRSEVQRRMRGTGAGNAGNEIRKARVRQRIARRRQELSRHHRAIELVADNRAMYFVSNGTTTDYIKTIDLITRFARSANNHLAAIRDWSAIDRHIVFDLCVSRQRRHRQRRQRHYRRHWRARRNLAVGQGARARNYEAAYIFTADRCALWINKRSRLKHIMRPPHRPHAGGEVWIEVAVKN